MPTPHEHPEPVYLDLALRNGIDIPARQERK